MLNPILNVNEKHKVIDDDYFENYGGEKYSDIYNKFTTPAEHIIINLLDKNIYFNSLLDIGCASGELVRDLRQLGVSAYGIENNKKILKFCVAPNYCGQLNMRELNKIPSKSFDILYTNSMMYCFPQEAASILKEMNRICRKAVYFYCPFLKETNFEDIYRIFLASKIWWEKQFEEANLSPVTHEIYVSLKI